MATTDDALGAWESHSTINGWGGTLQARELDGRIEWQGTVTMSDNLNWRIVSILPERLSPAADISKLVPTDSGELLGVTFYADGNVFLHEDDQTLLAIGEATELHVDVSYPARDGYVRDRVPGPPGLSAYEQAERGGTNMSEDAFESALVRNAERGVSSTAARRIVVSTRADMDLDEGDVLLVIEE